MSEYASVKRLEEIRFKTVHRVPPAAETANQGHSCTHFSIVCFYVMTESNIAQHIANGLTRLSPTMDSTGYAYAALDLSVGGRVVHPEAKETIAELWVIIGHIGM